MLDKQVSLTFNFFVFMKITFLVFLEALYQIKIQLASNLALTKVRAFLNVHYIANLLHLTVFHSSKM